ncbi:MAG: HAD-IC family P-type ATPase [Ardenticatenaceae bacterium]|nr:HAD-IC family P-type ATPase [Ardenticatenaceae bacterium]
MVGLTQAEVVARRARGAGNRVVPANGRSYTQIIRTNIFSFFNNILYVIGIALIALGQTSDALMSVGLGVLNALVGTVQEIRAKRKLDQVALLNQPHVIVRRDNQEQTIRPDELVLGDVIVLRLGEQAMVDGRFLGESVVEMDESLLTGETDLVRKGAGDNILSGSYCVTGVGYYEAEKVGVDSYANQITASAREFQTSYTPLQQNVNFVVRLIMVVVAIMSLIIFAAAIIEGLPFSRLVEMAAVLTGLVPYGLFTMIVVSYALGAAKIAQQGALVQQTNAVESLSNIDVLCMDKTGTLTTNRLQFETFISLDDRLSDEEIGARIGRLGRSATTQNKTSEALAAKLPGAAEAPLAEVPFASARKWSALAFADGVYVLGALEMLARYLPETAVAPHSPLVQQAESWSNEGLRVLLLAHNPDVYDVDVNLPDLEPMALICLRDELRPFAAETMRAFEKLGIELKIISGDNPHTVAALARQAGMNHTTLVSGAELAALSEGQWPQVVQETKIFGRIAPEQKQAIVETLLGNGRYVAMMGDGVNDVLSLKKAQVGIAMQSGSQATRNIADMVLLNDSFAALQPAFSEGKSIIGGLTRAMYLFLVRVVASAFIIIAVAMMGLNFPFEPAQVALTLFTVGIPAFCLTLWARPLLLNENILRSLIRFVIPASILLLLFSLSIFTAMNYSVQNRFSRFDIPPDVVQAFQEQTGLVYNVDEGFTAAAATIVAQSFLSVFLSYTAFVLILFLEPPHRWFEAWTGRGQLRWSSGMVAALWVIFTAIVLWEPTSSYFGLIPMPLPALLMLWVLVFIWAWLLRYLWRTSWLERVLGV